MSGAPRRINVAVDEDTVAALEAVVAREGTTITEAVRRLIGYGEVVYTAVRVDGGQMLLVTTDRTREVVVL